MSDFFKYKIPEYYRAMITPEFLSRFKAKLVEIFNSPFDTWDEWLERSSTRGWTDALKAVAPKELLDYYKSLGWEDSDLFDEEVQNIAIEYGFCPQPSVTEKDDVDFFKYKIPAEYRAMITPEVLTRFKDELERVFKRPCDWSAWLYEGGTFGWHKAFKAAAPEELYAYYDALEWYDGDLFDGEIHDLAIEYGICPAYNPEEDDCDYGT